MIDFLAALEGTSYRLVRNWDNEVIAGNGHFTPTWVMLHHTGSVGFNVLNDIVAGHPQWPGIPKANIFISRDGVAHVVSQFTTYHAGRGGPMGNVPADGMNNWSVGIEVESLGRKRDFTVAQIKTIIQLCRNLLREMGQPVTHLINHSQWSSTGKVDTLYDINEFRSLIANYKESTVTATDDFLSLKTTAIRKVKTNTDIAVLIDGKDRWHAEELTGRHGLAVYTHFNTELLNQTQRDALWYGGVRTWYRQMPGNDVTGGNGPFPCARFGKQSQLVAHYWPHSVDKDYWQFMVRLYAFSSMGVLMNFDVEMATSEIKLIGDVRG